MHNEVKVSGIWLLGGIFSWGLDVIADPCFTKMPLKTLFFCGSSTHDFVMRSYMLAAFVLFAVASYFIVKRQRTAQEALNDAQEKLSIISSGDLLTGLLPICSYCKRIRDDAGNWIKIETYIEARSSAEFTHGICPDCEKKI